MDVEDIVRLRKNWPHLVKYLKPKDAKLLDKLYQHAVLNEAEFARLRAEENPKTRAVGLSAVLKRKGQPTFERFLACLRKHYDSLAKKIEKTSVDQADVEEQLELEKSSAASAAAAAEVEAARFDGEVPLSTGLRFNGYGRRQDVLGWLTDMSLSDPIESGSLNMSLSEEGLSGRSSDPAPLTPGAKSLDKKGSQSNVCGADAWNFRSMRLSRGAETFEAGAKLRQSTRTAPVGDSGDGSSATDGDSGGAGQMRMTTTTTTQALIHAPRSAPPSRQPRSKTPEPLNPKPRTQRDLSAGSARRIKCVAAPAPPAVTPDPRISPARLHRSPDPRLSPNGVGGAAFFGVDNRRSSPGVGAVSNNNNVRRSPLHNQYSVPRSSVSNGRCSNAPLFSFGREGRGAGEFRYPRSVMIDDEQKVYVVDRGNSRIQVFSTAGSYLYQFGIGSKFIGNGSDVWCTTTDVALSKSGNCLICPRVVCAKSAKPWPLSGLSEAAEIQVYTKTGGLVSCFKYQELQFGLSVAVNSKGHIIVPDYETPFIYNFNADGCLISRYGGPGKEPGRFDCPTSVCSGIDDDILVTDSTNQRVHVLDKFGELRTCFGSKGDQPSQFQWPAGVCLDASGAIVVSDSVNNRIQMFSYDGNFLRTIADADAGLDHPCGVAVSPDGLLYVADQKNHCVKVFRY